MSTDCCTYECTRGPGCPVRSTIVPASSALRSCDDMGVCQHPEAECATHCKMVDVTLTAAGVYSLTPWDHIAYWGAMLLVYGFSTLLTLGALGYFWAEITSAFWALAAVLS